MTRLDFIEDLVSTGKAVINTIKEASGTGAKNQIYTGSLVSADEHCYYDNAIWCYNPRNNSLIVADIPSVNYDSVREGEFVVEDGVAYIESYTTANERILYSLV